MIDTTRDMTAAYIVATAIYVAYSISLWARARRYRRELDERGDDR
jgi:hypothetical protein